MKKLHVDRYCKDIRRFYEDTREREREREFMTCIKEIKMYGAI